MRNLLCVTAVLLAACGSNGGSGNLEVRVTYGAGADQSQVAAVHAWVVDGTDAVPVSCNLLVAGAQEPYDVTLELLGEGGVRSDGTLDASVSRVEGVAYVVAYDFVGAPLYAGCTPVTGSPVSVTLGPMLVYSCPDPTTPEGARCDDGNDCSTNERCRSGSCTDGVPIDCSTLDGPCSTGMCVAGTGCVSMATNESLPCDDGLVCTGSGVCTSGTCVAPPVACSAPPGPCLQAGICVEALQRCVYVPKATGTPCDDGNGCRTGDLCTATGLCQAGTNLITGAGIECDGNACTGDDSCSAGVCTAGTAPSTATTCDDGNPCTLPGTCSATACTSPGFATGTQPCWDTNYCYLGDRCSGFSSTCTFDGTGYDTDFDNDFCYRSTCGGCVDCDDNDPTIYQFGTERCADLKDNDCDGVIDELACVP